MIPRELWIVPAAARALRSRKAHGIGRSRSNEARVSPRWEQRASSEGGLVGLEHGPLLAVHGELRCEVGVDHEPTLPPGAGALRRRGGRLDH